MTRGMMRKERLKQHAINAKRREERKKKAYKEEEDGNKKKGKRGMNRREKQRTEEDIANEKEQKADKGNDIRGGIQNARMHLDGVADDNPRLWGVKGISWWGT